MAKDTETLPLELQGGANITKVKKDAKKIWDAYIKAETDIAAMRAQQTERRENLVSMGIPKTAFSAVRARHKLDAEKRMAHDHGMQVLSDAVGLKFDLFEDADEKNDDNPRSKPREESAVKPEPKKTEAKKTAAKKAAPKGPKVTAPKGPKVVKQAKPKGVADGDGFDLDSGKSRPLAGLDKAIEEAEASASGKLN